MGLACGDGGTCIAVPEPIAHWPLNEDAADVSGHGYNGLPLNGVVFDTNTANFDGVDSFIDISSFSNKFKEIVETMTIYIRVRASSWGSSEEGTEPILFGSGDQGELESQNGWWLMVTGSKATIDTETGAGVDNIVPLGDPLELDTWHDLVFTIDGDTLDLYRNGDWVAYSLFTDIQPAAEKMQIGGWLTPESVLNGAIDDVQVYDVVLEPAQIAALPSRR
jgi:hypothetical protein